MAEILQFGNVYIENNLTASNLSAGSPKQLGAIWNIGQSTVGLGWDANGIMTNNTTRVLKGFGQVDIDFAAGTIAPEITGYITQEVVPPFFINLVDSYSITQLYTLAPTAYFNLVLRTVVTINPGERLTPQFISNATGTVFARGGNFSFFEMLDKDIEAIDAECCTFVLWQVPPDTFGADGNNAYICNRGIFMKKEAGKWVLKCPIQGGCVLPDIPANPQPPV